MPDSTIALIWLVGIFLVCREFITWYWKMNETVKLLKEIRDEIKFIRDPEFVPKSKGLKGLLGG